MTYVASHAGIFELIFTDLLLSESLRILVFNLALEALEALVTVKMLPFSPQVQRIVRPHRRFHRILLLAHNASTTVAGNAAQPSPEFLAAVVQAVKALLPGEQASVSRPDPSGNSSVLDQATNSSSSAMLGGISDQDLSSQASALWTAGTGFSTHSSLAQVSSSQRRPAPVVPSFVRRIHCLCRPALSPSHQLRLRLALL